MQSRFLFFVAVVLLAAQGCCTRPQLGHGVSRNADGLLQVQVPSIRAQTIAEALNLASEPMRIELGKGEFRAEEDDVERVREQRAMLHGAGHKVTTVSVPENVHHQLENYCQDLYLRRRRVYQSSFAKFWSDLGEGLYKLFRFIVTGR